MPNNINVNGVYVPSDDIVSREIEGELIIVPLTSNVANMEDELYSLNDTGRAIWLKLDGKNTIRKVVDLLTDEYDGDAARVEEDVTGLLDELYTRKMIIEKKI